MSMTTRERILRATARIVEQQGIARMTLEAVADAAGLSKGGLIYHFPSKEALLEAMVEHLITITEQGIEAHQSDDRRPGSWTRGYLATCTPAGGGDASDNRMAAAVLAANAGDPRLLDPMRERQHAWRRALTEDGIDPVDALVVRLAADGLWMNDLFGLPAVDEHDRAAVIARLRALSGEST